MATVIHSPSGFSGSTSSSTPQRCSSERLLSTCVRGHLAGHRVLTCGRLSAEMLGEPMHQMAQVEVALLDVAKQPEGGEEELAAWTPVLNRL